LRIGENAAGLCCNETIEDLLGKTNAEMGLTSGVIGLLTGPHQISFSEPGSLTILLSNGERPVFAPEYAVRAPEDVMADPVS
jgi:hypothetical protein